MIGDRAAGQDRERNAPPGDWRDVLRLALEGDLSGEANTTEGALARSWAAQFDVREVVAQPKGSLLTVATVQVLTATLPAFGARPST